MRQAILTSLTLVFLLCLSACTKSPGEKKAEFFVFGTLLDVTVWVADESRTDQAFSELQQAFQEMHRDWHAWEPGLLTEINRGFAAGLPVLASPSILEMTRFSQQVEKRSGGRFNPAIGALIGLWGFHTSEFPVQGPPPRRSRIEQLVSLNPSSLDIRINGQVMSSLNPAVQLDFGGIAKGYAIDRAIDILRSNGIDNAIVNAGGDLRAIGTHGDRPWRIAVRDPAGGIIGTLQTGPDESVFTSGNYQRFRQDDESRYPHILDPRNGWPVQDVASVTVITQEGWLADSAATALTVAGIEDWPDVARALGLDLVMVVDESGTAYLTKKMNARLTFVEGVTREIVAF